MQVGCAIDGGVEVPSGQVLISRHVTVPVVTGVSQDWSHDKEICVPQSLAPETRDSFSGEVVSEGHLVTRKLLWCQEVGLKTSFIAYNSLFTKIQLEILKHSLNFDQHNDIFSAK